MDAGGLWGRTRQRRRTRLPETQRRRSPRPTRRHHSRRPRAALDGEKSDRSLVISTAMYSRGPWRLVVQAENNGLETLLVPEAAESPPHFAFCSFPNASPAFAPGSGKQKTVPRDRSKHFVLLVKFGAGEAIRTPDPNLGKVMLYP